MPPKVVHLFKSTQSAGGTSQSKTSDLLVPNLLARLMIKASGAGRARTDDDRIMSSGL
ncbi:MAG: hypothetical protein RL147_869 [Actinomycetota bacterium]